MIKKIFIALVAIVVLLIAVVAIASFATPTDFKVEREVTINKPKAEVYNYVRMLKNQNDWGPWYKKEPTMKQEFRGTDGTVGFVSYWNGKDEQVGEGEQEIKKLVENERMETELRFKRPFESKADAFLILESAGENQTKTKWGFSGSMPRPMNVMLLVMDMDKEVGKDFGDGLANLKTIMEKQ
jgi:uncharacterized protein YndB with AHSA1/START domain